MLDHPHQAMMRYNYNNPPSFPHQPEATANNGCYADYGGNGYGYGYGRGHDHSGSFGISGFNNNGYGNQNFSGATVNSGYYSADRNRYYTTNNHDSPIFNNSGSFHGSGNGSYYGGGFDARNYYGRSGYGPRF
ncbi:uncharacterized protein LOC107483445 [Arachis duranensis]|uniref:Uncharacterized protein LOC107483445 n=1 Tax=Arachis duranensis TaxID=130453 RepID=A0A6P4D0T0_ARADU|nr:uncharacterized protein LOC107483445 [Arachis duranensis]XP_057757070.1 uncharacterized protein LOC130976269 [Arachis stenosperma]QHO37743.1 uncharacterized protein DS421_4g114180 [Arachis hypogaea]